MASENFFFFFGSTKIPNEQESLTGAQVKALIVGQVSDFDESHHLVLEGQGNDEDRVIGDDETLSLAIGAGEGPRRFFSKPPANFGARI